jgi:DNA-binding NarL/FixJ family response regulator
VIKVLVADDHAVVRAGISHVLGNADDVEVVGEARDGEEAVELARTRGADVVLMDLSMPVLDGIDATRRIREEAPDAQVVVLTSFSDRGRILKALDAGAIGYLLKDAEPAELLAGIRAAARGESPLAPKAATALVEARTRRDPADKLSDREREVLTLVAAGRPNKLIALRLGISEKTVKAHLTNVFRRIGVDDRMQAALWAQQHGLVGDEPRS